MARLLELPPVPADLKPILPFLQRADELKFQDPVMSYWSAYTAAHNGIALKSKDPASRNFLATLLATLEKMKEAIGPNDAIDVESASSAYVENFALHIFQRADEEDRRGQAKKTTATKFLAAATFLKILKVFPEATGSDAVEDKIRYARWKAADISKALREGRKPTPGSPGSAAPAVSDKPPSPPSPSKRITPPPHLPPDTIARANRISPPTTPLKGDPGTWSTAATPGTPSDRTFIPPESPVKRTGPKSSGLRNAWVSDVNPSDDSNKPAAARTAEHFVPPPLPIPPIHSSSGVPIPELSPSAVSVDTPSHPEPTPFIPNLPVLSTTPPNRSPPSSFTTTPPSASAPMNKPPSPPGKPQIYTPTSLSNGKRSVSPPSPPRPAPVSPAQIATVQKHCRFAISALDYEDVEQAKKELRTALAMLGG